MGVDSGLPDFRGDEGFWRAYPPLRQLGLSFIDMANPAWFEQDPHLAWGFYGHRQNLYRSTQPHEGFDILRDIAPHASRFVFTSNVDGQFQRAGFDPNQILEVHGSIHFLQSCSSHEEGIWAADSQTVVVDETSFRAIDPLPVTPDGRLARPNILMFGDGMWNPHRTQQQAGRFQKWLADLGNRPVVVLEFGAGTGVPTVRNLTERMLQRPSTTVARINPREAHAPSGMLRYRGTALEACRVLAEQLRSTGAPPV